ncbi:hypothetical protein DFR71_6299 [Nocardia alba]|uniref:Uncharacterized protein n=1 Tax=Nocardia alba TaxID=225051 RepID=A0A4R1F6P2_9NOCA|nr:hypothetical protein DFR71_6299 [Nocardia alba]
MTDEPKPDDPADLAPWSSQSLFSERHSDATGPDQGPVPGNELPTFSAAVSRLADR